MNLETQKEKKREGFVKFPQILTKYNDIPASRNLKPEISWGSMNPFRNHHPLTNNISYLLLFIIIFYLTLNSLLINYYVTFTPITVVFFVLPKNLKTY